MPAGVKMSAERSRNNPSQNSNCSYSTPSCHVRKQLTLKAAEKKAGRRFTSVRPCCNCFVLVCLARSFYYCAVTVKLLVTVAAAANVALPA